MNRHSGVFGYLGRVLIGVDQLLNAALDGFPDETLSSRLGRRLKRKRKDAISAASCAVLDAIEKDHCQISIEETPEGETDPHHLGRVIRELPRKVPALALVAVLGLSGCALRDLGTHLPADWTCWENEAGQIVCGKPAPRPSPTPTPCPDTRISPPCQSPSPSPSASPTPAPEPSPSPTPTPAPLPTPRPTPVPSPSPTPQPSQIVTPPIDAATGNYPTPPNGVCPAHFKGQFDRVGIHVAGQTSCQQGTVCRRVTLWATQKAAPPYCPHAPGRRECEMWRPCQEPQFVDYVNVNEDGHGGGILMQISHPDWGNQWGRLDKQTCDTRNDQCPPGMSNPVHNFNGHDRAVDRRGVTKARACMPDGSKCSETTYRTDQ